MKKTINYEKLVSESNILDMAQEARLMARSAIESFLHYNIELARKVLQRDDIVDQYNKKIFKILVDKMEKTRDA